MASMAEARVARWPSGRTTQVTRHCGAEPISRPDIMGGPASEVPASITPGPTVHGGGFSTEPAQAAGSPHAAGAEATASVAGATAVRDRMSAVWVADRCLGDRFLVTR